MFLTFKSLTQKTISKHHPLRMQGNIYIWVNVTANSFYFSLNVLKFELQFEWTPQQIILSGHRVL